MRMGFYGFSWQVVPQAAFRSVFPLPLPAFSSRMSSRVGSKCTELSEKPAGKSPNMIQLQVESALGVAGVARASPGAHCAAVGRLMASLRTLSASLEAILAFLEKLWASPGTLWASLEARWASLGVLSASLGTLWAPWMSPGALCVALGGTHLR